MNLKLEQLSAHLNSGLQSVYIISGDEHLLVQEACDQIRQAAKNSGFTEREIYTVEPQYKWDDFLASGNSLSLFSEKKLIELRIPNGKPGDAGSKAIQHYLSEPSETNLLLVITPKLEKSTQNSKWFKALSQAGASIVVWPIDARQLPQWIKGRFTQAGLQADSEAIKMLANLVDGNLLAASQEIEKLTLLVNEPQITADTIRQAVSDSSRYNVFNLIDTAAKGDKKQSLKILSRLKGEGVDPISVAWALSREIRLLSQIVQDIEKGLSPQQAMQTHRVWKSRQPIVSKAISNLTSLILDQLTQQSAEVDQMIKGILPGNPWDKIEAMIMVLTGAPTALQIYK